MKSIKKTVCLLVAAVLLLGALSACGGGQSEQKDPAEEYVYTASYSKLQDEKISNINNCCWYNGRIYFIGSVEDGVETYEYDSGERDENGNPVMVTEEYPRYRSMLFSAAEDGSDVRELPGYTPREVPTNEAGERMGDSYVNGMTMDAAGTLWISECVYSNYFDPPEGSNIDENSEDAYQYYVYTENYYIRAFDAQGNQTADLDLAALAEGSENGVNFYNFAVDGAGNIYLIEGYSGSLYVLDSAGKPLFTVPSETGWFNSLVRMADGSVAVTTTSGDDGKSVFKTVDLAAKGLKELGEPPANAWNFIPGDGEYDLYYNTDISLFGYDMKTGETTRLVSWIDADVDSNNINSIMPISDGRVLCTAYVGGENGDGGVELVTLTKTPASEQAQKTVLTYACMYLDWNVRSQIIKFNKTNPTYRIEVRDYSEYNTQDDYSAGLTKLTTEMISGNIPDILAIDNIPFEQYASRGLFEDLWPYIDADAELGGREALVEPLFKALSTGDKLYRICSTFSVQSAYALADVVGDKPGWTLDQLMAAYETLPEGATIFAEDYTKGSILGNICYMYLNDLVDWETGKCSFDGDLFKSLLALTEKFPLEYEYDSSDDIAYNYDPMSDIKSGRQLMNQYYFYSFSDYYWELGADLSGITFIGYPTADGSVGSAFSVQQSMAMSSKCENKDGAWEFMRYFLTEEYAQNNMWQFSSNANVLADMLKTEMTPEYITDENGNKVEQPKMVTTDYSGNEIKIYAMDQATADKLMSLINDTPRIWTYDEKIYNIVNDECAAFFNGQKSLDDTCKMIQSKVSLYVNEQK